MNSQKPHWILHLITATILATISIQLYWNFKNYQQNKHRILNEIQLSLDNAVEIYHSELSKTNFLTIVKPKERTKKFSVSSIEFGDSKKFDLKQIMQITKNVDKGKKITQFSKDGKTGIHIEDGKIESVKIFKGKKASDSLKLIKGLRTIFISIKEDSLQKKKFDSILQKQLFNKKISIDYLFSFYKNDTLQKTHSSSSKIFIPLKKIDAKSTFLTDNKRLTLEYSNPTKEAFKRSSTGILLSLLLSLAVISSLFYLLKIINQQKQLAEIKNDLISNITHEFKTPITTVSTALEAIGDFNVIDDKEKTKNYVSISKNQIEKLHLMVEKLLETATLDSEKVLLKKDEIDLVDLIKKSVKKHQLICSYKNIIFNSSKNKILVNIDIFHFENAISNLIDNAIKYGGDTIKVILSSKENNTIITIKDNGKGIEKNQQDKIFDKFYRIPKGNTHDVKGFGIGLYYTQKIIEKHNGSITLKSNNNQTTFTISLPDEH